MFLLSEPRFDRLQFTGSTTLGCIRPGLCVVL
jgi:hypothetical protein